MVFNLTNLIIEYMNRCIWSKKLGISYTCKSENYHV